MSSRQIIAQDIANQLEPLMLSLPQAECSVSHHFSPGIYIRELSMKAGTFAIGHSQKFDHLNIMLSGKVAMLGDNGEITELVAPLRFIGKPGRKMGYVIEDTVWQNIYATTETDIDVLESLLLEKSEPFMISAADSVALSIEQSIIDNEDFAAMAAELGISVDTIRSQSENESDRVDLPSIYAGKITVRNSPIEGKGVFLSSPIKAGETIGPARICGMRTELGRYVNHSKNPNAKYSKRDNGDIFLSAISDISGCKGGGIGDEITVDYRDAYKCNRGDAVR